MENGKNFDDTPLLVFLSIKSNVKHYISFNCIEFLGKCKETFVIRKYMMIMYALHLPKFYVHPNN